jgi:acyl-CoA synthetase (AMP-forming)/AMP-acid ligase II
MPNSGEYISVYYGIHMAGCVVVALNQQEPAPVIARLLEHCGAEVLFVDQDYKDLDTLREISGAGQLHIVPVHIGDGDAPDGNTEIWQQIRVQASPDFWQNLINTRSGDLAMIIYTSGTTGKPKGVMLSQKNLFANTESILEYLPITGSDRCLNVLPFYYSFGNSILLTHMTAGASLVLQNTIAFPHAVLKAMEEHGATSFYGVPTTYALLFPSHRIKAVDLSSLKYIAQAGGPMSVTQQQQLLADLPGVEIFVMYGQTEASARLTYLDPCYLIEKSGSVGKGIPGVELRVGERPGSKHSAAAPGEIYASGENIMIGYWNDTQTTSEVVRDGWLKTGDLGYFDSDGFLFITGRSSDMIKTGANRVSPAEIEEVISAFPEVSEVGVYGVPDEILGQAIAAAIVLNKGTSLEVQEIQRRCLGLLTNYKVPKFIRFVLTLPKTSSGKLKRHVLAKEHKETVHSE